MAHYAFIDENNIVQEVIVGLDESETIEGMDVETWYSQFRGMACKRTSYNMYGGVHLEGETPFRKNYAGVGYTYDPIRDAFIPPQTYPSWILNENTCLWESPVPFPNDGNPYVWNEETLSWEILT